MTHLYVIMGCTAGGKGALGLELARRHNAEILSVDSMKIYRGMDIGTAKPTPQARAQIPHHGIDIADPWEGFSVARYLEVADAAIAQVHAAGRPILAVGGTSLYLKALIEGLFEGPSRSPELREELKLRAAEEGLASLHAELSRVDPQAAQRIHPNDERRIVRALEVYRLTGQPISQLQQQWDAGRQRYECHLLWLRHTREDTNSRVNARVKRMVEQGLVHEVRRLLEDPRGLSTQAAAALGYAEIIRHLRGEWPLDHAIEQIKINTRQFAKSQRTWFRRFTQAKALDVAADAKVADVAGPAAELLGLTQASAADRDERRPEQS